MTPCRETRTNLRPEGVQVSCSPTYNLTLHYPSHHQHLNVQSQLPSSVPSSQLSQQIIGSLHSKGADGWNINNSTAANKYKGYVFI